MAEPEGPDEPLHLQQPISSSPVVFRGVQSPGPALLRYIGLFGKHAPEGPSPTAAKCQRPSCDHLFSLSGIGLLAPRNDKKKTLDAGSTALGICPCAIYSSEVRCVAGRKFGFKGHNIFYATWI